MMYVFSATEYFAAIAALDRPRPPLDFKHYECLKLVVANIDAATVEDFKRRDVRLARLGLFSLAKGSPYGGAMPDSRHWNRTMMALDGERCSGGGVTVGLVDTGVNTKHPALENQVTAWAAVLIGASSVELVTTNVAAGDSDQERWHGTRVAGVICGQKFKDQTGVAPEARLSVVRLPAPTSYQFSDRVLIEVLDYFCRTKVRIVNISVDAGTEVEAQEFILRAAVDAGLIPIIPIGNDGDGMIAAPGRCPSAIGVGAVSSSGAVSDFSGSAVVKGVLDPDLLAPGEGLYTCAMDAYGKPVLELENGTSYAAPHIAGLAALILQKEPALPADKVRQRIYDACNRTPNAARALRGVPDATRAASAC
jgi:subtilisin family serine protease